MRVLRAIQKWSIVVGLTNHIKNKCIKYLSVIPFIAIVYYIFFEILFLIENIMTLNVATEMDIFYAIAAYLKVFFNILWLWPKKEIVHEIIEKIKYLVKIRKTALAFQLYERTERFANLLTNAFIYYIIFAAMGTSIMPVVFVLVQYLKGRYVPNMWFLALKSKIPFLEQDRLPGYIVAFTLSHISIISLALVYAWVPSFFSNICLYILAFIKDLNNNLKTLPKLTSNQRDFKNKLRVNIQFHQEILLLVEKFGELMTGLLFITFLADVIILCSGLLQLLLIFDPNDVNVYLFQTVVACLAAFLQIIYFSFFGDLVMTNLMTVSLTVYLETDWYNYPPNVRRQLLLIMVRSQKTFIFKGFGLDVVRCSRENFTNIVNATAKLLAVVQSVFLT